MAIDPVKIPANVQVEEKIFGPVSLRQIFILIATGGLSYIIWTVLQRNGYYGLPFTIASFTPLYVGAAFAFVKINDVSLMRLIFLAIERIQKPTVRSFGPRQGITVNIRTNPNEDQKKQGMKTAMTDDHMKELSSLLDSNADEESDIDDEGDVLPVQAPARPVDPRRIQAQPLADEDVDGLSVQSDDDHDTSSSSHAIFRDIVPPAGL